jgi:hypothetical protein
MKPFKIKSESELQAIKREFINGANGGVKDDLWLFSGLNEMTTKELLDRLYQVDNQATMMTWRIWWAIRQHYESDQLFGQFIAELKSDSTQTLCLTGQKEIYRAWTAGKFCEKYGINDLSEFGVSQTAIYELSRPVNEAIAGQILDSIKLQKLPVNEVKRLLEQARVVSTIEEREKTTESSEIIEADIIEGEEQHVEVIDYRTIHRREELLQELSEIEAPGLSEQQIATEILTFVRSYKNASPKIISPIQALINELEKIVGVF